MRPPRRAATLRPIVKGLMEACGIDEVPVAVESIAEHLGARVRYSPFDGELAGILVRDDDGTAVIGVNSAQHIYRQRFTIAHQCGHLALHKGRDVYIDRSFWVNFGRRDASAAQSIDSEEIEANRFAAELLIPRDKLIDEIGGFDIEDEEAFRDLSKKYLVSVPALNYRIHELLSDDS